jgi:phosphatidylglycerophosphatase A
VSGSSGQPARLDARFMLAHPAHWLALSAGLGLVPFAPGTVGALGGLAIGWGLQAVPLAAAIILLVLLGALGVWACDVTAHSAGVHDHQSIVIDETWAMAAVVVFSPPGPIWLLLGFVAFRAFDIAKPWPVSRIDTHVEGGIGVMADDGAAAVLAIALLHTVARTGWIPA